MKAADKLIKEIKNRVLFSRPVKWRELQFIQNERFKSISEEEFAKLVNSILNEEFVESFKVWLDPADSVEYCLDGYHRCKALEHIEQKGLATVPESFSGDFLECTGMEEAARLVLIYSSRYAKVQDEGLYEFLSLNNLQLPELVDRIDIPDINMAAFEQNFYGDPDPEKDHFNDPGIAYKSQYGVIVFSASEQEQQEVYERLTEEGFSCKIVVT